LPHPPACRYSRSSGGTAVNAIGYMGAALFLGWAVANRRAFVAEIRDRAERAERTREEEARRRVDAERLRIARELHDVVAHTISTINIQAGVGAHVIDSQPDQAARALESIKQTSKEALRELRAILDVLLLILQLYTWVVIATAIMSWLIAFDVVNFRSDFVRAVW